MTMLGVWKHIFRSKRTRFRDFFFQPLIRGVSRDKNSWNRQIRPKMTIKRFGKGHHYQQSKKNFKKKICSPLWCVWRMRFRIFDKNSYSLAILIFFLPKSGKNNIFLKNVAIFEKNRQSNVLAKKKLKLWENKNFYQKSGPATFKHITRVNKSYC